MDSQLNIVQWKLLYNIVILFNLVYFIYIVYGVGTREWVYCDNFKVARGKRSLRRSIFQQCTQIAYLSLDLRTILIGLKVTRIASRVEDIIIYYPGILYYELYFFRSFHQRYL